MTHKTPIEFSLLLDGRLAPEEEAAWRSKLAADPVLAASFENFKSAQELLQTSREISELPAGFDARLRMRLHTEELRARAKNRATGAAGRESWWQRAALALGGVAAGAAMVLAFDPSGLWRDGAPVQTEQPIAHVELPNSLPDSNRLSPSEVRYLASRKAMAVQEFERTLLSCGQEIEPAALAYGVRKFLGDPSRGLLSNARIHEHDLGEETVVFLEQLDAFSGQVIGIAESARQAGRGVTTEELLEGLSRLRQFGMSIRQPNGDEIRLRITRIAGDDSIPDSEHATEARQGFRVGELFGQGKFQEAVDAAKVFLEQYPSSRLLGPVTRWAVLSLQRLGKSLDALELLHRLSADQASILRGFSHEEIEALKDAAIRGNSTRYTAEWVMQSDGSSALQVTSDPDQEVGLIQALASRLQRMLPMPDSYEALAKAVEYRFQNAQFDLNQSQSQRSRQTSALTSPARVAPESARGAVIVPAPTARE